MEENKVPETSLPKFDLPKSAAPTIKIPSNIPVPQGVAPAFGKRPEGFGEAVVDEQKESKALVAVDAVCAVIAVAFAILLLLEKLEV